MYHLLVSQNGWEQYRDSLGNSRVFENTLPNLENQFKPQGNLDQSKISQIPALFATEIGGDGTQLARVGYINRIKMLQNDVHIEYHLDPRIPPIPNDRLERISEKLDIEGREFSRTHWAIKDVDLLQVLSTIGIKMSQQYIQTILFGSPGTGKSYRIENKILPVLRVEKDGECCIKTVFHPEYTYGDFMGKLLPLTKKRKGSEEDIVTYNYYEGHFLRALAQAYRNLYQNSTSTTAMNVALVIDEINRGNSSAIFGTIFQLLDRNDDGWSSYGVNLSEMEFTRLVDSVFEKEVEDILGKIPTWEAKKLTPTQQRIKVVRELTKDTDLDFLVNSQIKIPPNLSIIATMNTSDESIYYMDSAFKRRWEWEYIDIESVANPALSGQIAFHTREKWEEFVKRLNRFIKKHYRLIRKIEDKQIGFWFIKDEPITKGEIQNKLMFFLWDTVFPRNKKPLVKLLNVDEENLVAFGDFANKVNDFLIAIYPEHAENIVAKIPPPPPSFTDNDLIQPPDIEDEDVPNDSIPENAPPPPDPIPPDSDF